MKAKRLTITDVANTIGVTPRTIMRWEKAGKIKKPKRDWRGWRFYLEEDLQRIREFFESSYEYDEANGMLLNASKEVILALMTTGALFASLILCAPAYARTNFTPKNEAVVETKEAVNIHLEAFPAQQPAIDTITEDTKYTLGPNDVIEIEVLRHPEFSGEYAVNSEGKIEYKYIGDVLVTGLTKTQVKDRIYELVSEYVIEPRIDVRITAYLSKVFYVVGEVGRPGKFYMRGNEISVREALMQAGLPMQTAAMDSCRLITPNESGKKNYTNINASKLLYEGDLSENLIMIPGDVLYVPATFMTKLIRVISPVTTVTGQAAGAAARGMMLAP